MDKKVVLVTGGSRGIGLAIAKKFALNNYNVVINYCSDDSNAKKALKELNDIGCEALLIKADVSDEESVKNMMNTIIHKFNRLDCVINNASICLDKPLLTKTKDDFMKILSVNLVGTFLVSKYSYEYLSKQEYPSIINISSTNGIDTIYPDGLDYDASKAGVISLTKNLAREFSPKIRVNCVAPGWCETDMTKDISPIYKKEEEEKILLKRFSKPEEIANVVWFLSTKEAVYINSEVIRTDGGFSE